jgi:SAM-dependent methyltransferase
MTNPVAAYWDAAPCGSKLAAAEPGSAAFFQEHATRRYQLEPMIRTFADFPSWSGRRVLEVGVGLGADTAEFARAGAMVSGVDISMRSLELARARLDHAGLDADLRIADGGSLPYESATFDLVWSWGVIHHAPDPPAVVREIRRVLRPGGEVRAMLYARRSWFALGLWLREVLRGHPTTLTNAIARLESPGTRAYSEAGLCRLFGESFGSVDIERWATPYDRRVVGPLASDSLGWFAGVRGIAH